VVCHNQTDAVDSSFRTLILLSNTKNRKVSQAHGVKKYKYHSADSLDWSLEEIDFGKQLHIKEFPAGFEVKMFRIVAKNGDSAASPKVLSYEQEQN
jgi:hypothetical protein